MRVIFILHKKKRLFLWERLSDAHGQNSPIGEI